MANLTGDGNMLINFAWPRAASNPEPNQTNGLLDLGLHWLNKIPILYTVLAFVLIVGTLYYLASARRHSTPVVVPVDVDA